MTSPENTSQTINIEEKIGIRIANYDDTSFIYATWLRSLYYGNPWYRMIDKDTFFDKYKLVVSNLLDNSTVAIACLKNDPEVIVGYAVLTNKRLHYVYVKEAWRKLGIAKLIIPDNIESVSHLTSLGAKIKPKNWTFNPFLD